MSRIANHSIAFTTKVLKLIVFDSKKSEHDDFPLACHWQTGASQFFGGLVFISATQISEIHRVMGQEIRVASFKLWNKIFNKNDCSSTG